MTSPLLTFNALTSAMIEAVTALESLEAIPDDGRTDIAPALKAMELAIDEMDRARVLAEAAAWS